MSSQRPPLRVLHTLTIALALAVAACTPYAVHTSAQPLAKGDQTSTMIATVVPQGVRLDDSTSQAMPGLDWEKRVGLDDRSDAGLRINALSGAILSYKRRLDGPSARQTTATAIMVGAGFVNFGAHLHGEVTLITAAPDSGRAFVPYGGLRVVQIVPLSTGAVSDTPTIGVFGGSRLGGRDGNVAVELGVFYDRSALGLRRNDIVIVPSISFTGMSWRRRR